MRGELSWRDCFVTFPVEVDVGKMIDENPMIAVSSYPNAVLSQWFLPYNIRPKIDWPDAAMAT